jgi:protein-tyrosine phosphatase
MQAEVYWIGGIEPHRIAILPRPRAGDWLEDEMRSMKQQGVDVLVSLLTREEVVELELNPECDVCREQGIEFISFPIPDQQVPSLAEAHKLAQRLLGLIHEGKGIGIHCRAGIGRSSLIAASLLLFLGLDAETAFQKLAEARGCPVPDTQEQREWVDDFARTFVRMASSAGHPGGEK